MYNSDLVIEQSLIKLNPTEFLSKFDNKIMVIKQPLKIVVLSYRGRNTTRKRTL